MPVLSPSLQFPSPVLLCSPHSPPPALQVSGIPVPSPSFRDTSFCCRNLILSYPQLRSRPPLTVRVPSPCRSPSPVQLVSKAGTLLLPRSLLPAWHPSYHFS